MSQSALEHRNQTDLDDQQDLRRRVLNYIVGHKLPTLNRIAVEADRGTVVLRGQVHSYYQKQLCLNCCRRVAGVYQLIDEITVASA
jgi:osmotically-inducible protein OsmY